MGNVAWRRALETARSRLIALPKGSGVRCLLIREAGFYRPIRPPSPNTLDPHFFPRNGAGGTTWHGGIVLPGGLIEEADGTPVFADEPTLDVNGKPMVTRDGRFPRFAPLVLQDTFLYGNETARPVCCDIATALGTGATQGVKFNRSVDPLTLYVSVPWSRWATIVFDIAWAAARDEIPGASIRARKSYFLRTKESIERGYPTHATQGTFVELDPWGRQLRFDPRCMEKFEPIPDSPYWFFSTLEDFVSASIGAVDVLLSEPATQVRSGEGVGEELAGPPDNPASPGGDKGSDRGQVVPKRPSEDAFKAWRLRDLTGLKTQQAIADAMTTQLGRKVHQGEVSRWLKEVDTYRMAGGVFPDLPGLSREPQSLDPAILEMGERMDQRTIRQRPHRAPDAV